MQSRDGTKASLECNEQVTKLTVEQQKRVEDNLGLVGYVMNHMGIRHKYDDDACEDLFQSGVIGLMRAAVKYNPSIGEFSTYAFAWIRQGIQRGELTCRGIIIVPAHAEYKVHEKFWRHPVSLFKPIRDGMREYKLCDILDAEDFGLDDAVYRMDLVQEMHDLRHIMKTKLTAREREIISQSILEEKTYEQIGKEFNLTRERIRQIREKGLRRLSVYFKRKEKKQAKSKTRSLLK